MDGDRVRVLLVEDNPGDARLVRLALQDARDPAFEVDWVQDLPQALERVASGTVDLVLTDLNLPSSSGLDTVSALRSKARRMPLVVLTGSFREAPLGQQAVHQGAQDYLDKDHLEPRILARVLTFALERKRLEQFREEFVQNVSHELLTPLTVAYGMLNALVDGTAGALAAEQQELGEAALRSVSHLSQMVEDLVEAARAEAGKLALSPRRLDLGGLASRLAQELRRAAEGNGLELSVQAAEGLPDALADPKRCRQVLFNLIANALKFTPRGGRVSVGVAASAAEPGFLQVSVTDTGPGVPLEARERVFDRLYQTGSTAKGVRRGLGLGLSISREIAVRQGGRIWLDAGPAGGSSFCFTVPVFSLSKELEPLLREPGPFCLIACEVVPAGTRLTSREAVEVLEVCAEILRAEVGPGGVLLPETAPQGREGLLFLACRSEPGEAVRLAGRIEAALAAEKSVARAGLHPEARAMPVPAGSTAEETAAGLGALLERTLARRGSAQGLGAPAQGLGAPEADRRAP